MIVKFLGIIDILAGLLYLFVEIFQIIPKDLLLFAGLILIVKGGAFILNFNVPSALDILCGIIILLSIIVQMPQFIVILVIIFLAQKGIISLI